MRNLAIIPARSGSKGLKDKNIKLLNGTPLIAYSIKAANDSGLFDEIMVSTDSELYKTVAEEYGAKVPFLRSKELSSDTAGSWDVVIEVLNKYKVQGEQFDTVCLLQPTSPLRAAEDIRHGYELYSSKSATAVTSVCEMDHSPLWCLTLPNDLSLKEYRAKTKSKGPRQNLETYYRFNGAIYIRTVEYQDSKILLLTDREIALVMERNRSIDIDVLEDFELAEYYLKKMKPPQIN